MKSKKLLMLGASLLFLTPQAEASMTEDQLMAQIRAKLDAKAAKRQRETQEKEAQLAKLKESFEADESKKKEHLLKLQQDLNAAAAAKKGRLKNLDKELDDFYKEYTAVSEQKNIVLMAQRELTEDVIQEFEKEHQHTNELVEITTI